MTDKLQISEVGDITKLLLLCKKNGIKIDTIDSIAEPGEARINFNRQIDRAMFLNCLSEARTPRHTRYDIMKEHFSAKDIYQQDPLSICVKTSMISDINTYLEVH